MNKNKSDNAKEVLFFFLKLMAIWLSWKIIFFITGEEKIPINERLFPALSMQWEKLNNAMRYVVLHGAEILLRIFGYATQNDGYRLRIFGKMGLGLGNYCLGFQLIYYFAMLIIISELSWRKKIVALVASVPIVAVINFFRVAILCIVVAYYPVLLSSLHDYAFNAVVLGVLFVYYLFLLRDSKTKCNSPLTTRN